jgi:dolichol kinase
MVLDPKTKKRIVQRKLLHLGIGFVYLGLFSLQYLEEYVSPDFRFTREELLWSLMMFLIFFIFYEVIRLETKLPIPFRTLIKEKEAKSHVDGINLLVMAILVTTFFQIEIAFVAVMIAVFGDAAASFGALYGKMKIFPNSLNKSTWEGVALSTIVNSVITVSAFGFGWEPFVIALTASFAEALVVHIDDNIVVPLTTALTAYAVYSLQAFLVV